MFPAWWRRSRKRESFHGLSQTLYGWFGVNLLTVALALLARVGPTSSFLANIPVVAAMILLVKGYFVVARLVPEDALGATFVEWPAVTLPVFVAMMFGGTLRWQRDLDRRFSQYRLRRYQRQTRQAIDVCNVHALRDSDHALSTSRVCTIRVGALLSDRSVTDLQRTAPKPEHEEDCVKRI